MTTTIEINEKGWPIWRPSAA